MKQVVFKSGEAVCVDTPTPCISEGQILVQAKYSCVSPGTEITGLDSTGRSLWDKAKANPEKVKAALGRMRKEGVFSVLSKARNKLEQESKCGYSAAGIVIGIGEGVSGFSLGDMVAVAGAGYANHASVISVPVNLAMPVPGGVSLKEASTCALGGIALQGIRRSEATLGETVVVTGCGAIGLLTVQMLAAAGIRIAAIDLDTSRLEMASRFGAELTINPDIDDPVNTVIEFTDGHGADKVILTLATASSMPVNQAFEMSRRKGRIVLVGVAGLELDRSAMYQKELDFVLSTSYGPGRYDSSYEELGIDYPIGYVRWTENRNMKAYLHLISQGKVDVDALIHEDFDVENAASAYQLIESDLKPLLVVLKYSHEEKVNTSTGKPQSSSTSSWSKPLSDTLKIGLIGSGSFVRGMHIPNLNQLGSQYKIVSVCDSDPLVARSAAKECNSEPKLFTDHRSLLEEDLDWVIIGTRHDTHSSISIDALQSGKAVFVEKPMCITREEFSRIDETIKETNTPYMVGYNRRFSPPALIVKAAIQNRVNPLMAHYTMSGGYIPYDSWVQSNQGGGRIIGEACHIFDLFRFLTGSPVVSVSTDGISPTTGAAKSSDNTVITITYEDGSVCSLLYTGRGSKNAPKERLEVFCDGKTHVLDDYVQLRSYDSGKAIWSSKLPDKGHLNEIVAFKDAISAGNRFPIDYDELKETWLISRQVADSLRS